MDEKRAIIDELLTQARIYLDEQANIVIQTVQEHEDISSSRSKCGKSLREIYTRPEEFTKNWSDYDLVVLKCENCNLIHAFWISPVPYDESFLIAEEDEYLGGRIIEPPQWKYLGKPEWGEGRPPKFSGKTAKTYERAVSQLDGFNRRLNRILQGKLAEMLRAGLNEEVINSARNRVLRYMRNNPLTEKQLVAIFAAAVYKVSNEQSIDMKKKISERQIESIFGVTRKTIRAWKKIVPSQ